MTEIRSINGSLTGKKYKPGLRFDFQLTVPCAEAESFALLIEHDRGTAANVNSLLRLADEGKAPYCVCVGVAPGVLDLPDGTQRGMRMNSYDFFDREYGDFLVYELIPYIEQEYSLPISPSPDMHFVSGGSSGGISAFVIAWFHPEYFRRVYMASPSFLAMGRGNEVPYLIRKYETKPIRIYEEYSENEPNDYFGWSRAIDEETREALVFANYDFRFKYFPGEGHSSRYANEEEAYLRNEWIWRGWRDGPVTAPGNSPRVSRVIPSGSRWERCGSFPKAENSAPAALAGAYDHVVLSNDGKVWYAANRDDDSVYMFVGGEGVSPDVCNLHAVLHTIPRQRVRGAIHMAVDRTDRLYVLTEIGVQCVRSFGLTDVILDLPDDGKPLEIAVADALYVRTDRGTYRRALCGDCVTDGPEKRKQTGYYD